MTNKYNKNYIAFNEGGIIRIKPFKKEIYTWENYKGYLIVGGILFLQMNNKTIKIHKNLLEVDEINEIIGIIEGHKKEIKME